MRPRTTSEDSRQERREQVAADTQAHHTDLEVVDDVKRHLEELWDLLDTGSTVSAESSQSFRLGTSNGSKST